MTLHYYILSLRWTRSGEEHVTWWGPDNSGYVSSLENAGRYTAERVHGNRAYYDNRQTTVSIPCEVAEKHARRIVLTDLVDRVVSEAIGEPVSIQAPVECATDDNGNPLECRECGHEPVSKGPSKIVAVPTKAVR